MQRATGRALAWACTAATVAFARAGRIEAALEAAERGSAIRPSPADTSVYWDTSGHVWSLCQALCLGGRLEESERLARRNYEEAAAGPEPRPAAAGLYACALSATLLAQGRIAGAISWGREAACLLSSAGPPRFLSITQTALAQALAQRGRPDEAEAVLAEREAMRRPWQETHMEPLPQAWAWVAAARGDLPRARELLRTQAAQYLQAGEFALESEALHDLARLGAAAETARRLRELAEVVEGPLATPRGVHATALADGDPEGLQSASRAFQEAGALLLAAEAATDGAAALRRSGDARRAQAAHWQAQALSARCEGAATPALVAEGARTWLTPREMELALLAAAGASNRDISHRLSLSIRTVENTLQRTYAKLGISSRAALAAAMDR